MRSHVKVASLAAVAVFALGWGGSPAFAEPSDSMIAGTLGVGWTDYLTHGSHSDDWLASGSAVLKIDNPGFNIQVNFDNSAVRAPAASSGDLASYGGDVYWRDYAGSIGINITDNMLTSSGVGSANYESFGLFGQWFALPQLTLEIKGGRFDGNHEGWYGDGAVVYYPYADIALSLGADYGDGQRDHHELKDASLLAEYLPVHEIPVSMYIGYDFAEYSQLSHHDANVLMFGLKAYLGGGGRSGTLVDYQRNGTTNWDGAPATLVGLNF